MVKTKNSRMNQENILQIRELLFAVLIIYILSRVLIWFEYAALSNILHNSMDIIGNLWRWDSGWYQGIVEKGYDISFDGQSSNWPFFPLWPLILKLCSLNGLFSIPVTGIFLNQLFFLGALAILALYLQALKFCEKEITFIVFLLAISPANIYFCAGLTESLFLLLSLSAFYFLKKEQFYAAVLCGALLSATRMTGAFFIFPLVICLYQTRKFSWIKSGILILLAISGLLIYVLYLKLHTGSAFGFLEVESQIPSWVRPGLTWDSNVLNQIYSVMTTTSHIYDRGIFVIALFLVSGILFKQGFVKEGVFNVLCVIPGLISGNMWNSFRFDTAIFTFYLGLLLFAKTLPPYGKYFIFALSVMMSVVCWFYWLSGSYYFA